MELDKKSISVLITVGTTQFQDLVKFTDSEQFMIFLKEIEMLLQKSQKNANINNNNNSKLEDKDFQLKRIKITYQIGKNGVYIPKQRKFSSWFRLSDKISQIYKEADIIFCHGGAGTLLQNLRNGKIMIAVANDTLAGNHQVQLIQQLNKQNYILGFHSTKDLSQNLQKIKELFVNINSNKNILKKYPKQCRNILNEIVFGDL